MGRIISFLMFILISSCSKTARLEPSGTSGYKFSPLDLGFDDVRIEEWKVGKNFSTAVGKGFAFTLQLPSLDSDDAQTLWNKRKVDSWYIKLYRLGNRGYEMIHHVTVPYGIHRDGEFEKGKITRITLNVYYAAASMSTRLANLQCPAMDHRKLISEFSIRDEKPAFKMMTITAGDENQVSGKLEDFSFGKNIINGGATLLGTYSAEIAFYSNVEKKIKSSAINFPQVLVVSKELDVVIPGCTPGDVPAHDPDDPKNSGGIEQFKFGH